MKLTRMNCDDVLNNLGEPHFTFIFCNLLLIGSPHEFTHDYPWLAKDRTLTTTDLNLFNVNVKLTQTATDSDRP